MNRDGALLLAALAFMAALAWAFAPGPPQTLALPAPQASAGGILWRDGQALVDVNQAGLELLQSLPGIGATLAQRILEDRAENGPYPSLEDLDRVPGIGPGKIAGLASRAAVSQG